MPVRLFLLSVLLIAAPAAGAATFFSSQSGPWNLASTWGGAGVPGAADHAVISAGTTVELNTANRTVGQLTIQSGGTLQPAYGVTATLTVNGALVNNGTLRNDPVGGFYLTIRAGGSVLHTGTWAVYETRLVGTAAQTLTLAGGAVFTGPWNDEDGTTNSPVVAGSDLVFTGSVDLKGSSLQMGGYRLDLPGASTTFQSDATTDGNVEFGAGGRLRMRSFAHLRNVRVTGTPTFEGQVRVGDGVQVIGNATVAAGDTLMAAYAINATLPVAGSLTNHGVVMDDNAGGYYLTLQVTGDVASGGVWSNYQTRLTGVAAQTLTLLNGTAVFESPLWDDHAASALVAGSDLRFRRNVYLQGATLQVGPRTLHLQEAALYGDDGQNYGGAPNPTYGTADFDGGTLHLTSISSGVHAFLDHVTIGGPVTLDGEVKVGIGVAMNGTVTVRAGTGVLEAQYGVNPTLPITGDLINAGIIRDDEFSGYWLTLQVTGNLTHVGAAWENYETVLTGPGAQTVQMGTSQHFGRADGGPTYWTIGADGHTSSAWKAAGSDLRFRAVQLRVDEDETLDMAGHRLELDGQFIQTHTYTAPAQGLVFLNGGALEMTADAYLSQVHLAGPGTLDGEVKLNGEVTMSSGFTVAPTGALMPVYGLSVDQTVGGDLTVHGTVSNDEVAGYWLTLTVGGDLTFAGGAMDLHQLTVGGQLVVPASAGTPTLEVEYTEITTHGLDVDGLVVKNGWVRSIGGDLDRFDGVTFDQSDGNAAYRSQTQLHVEHPGPGDFTVSGLTFAPLNDYYDSNGTHDTGLYAYGEGGVRVRILDSDAPGGDRTWKYVDHYTPGGEPVFGYTYFYQVPGETVTWPVAGEVEVPVGEDLPLSIIPQFTFVADAVAPATIHAEYEPGRRCSCEGGVSPNINLGFLNPLPVLQAAWNGAVEMYEEWTGGDPPPEPEVYIEEIEIQAEEPPPPQYPVPERLQATVVALTPAGQCQALGGSATGGIAAVGGGNIIAVGGGNIIAVGGGNIVAVGGGNRIPAPPGTLRPQTPGEQLTQLLSENERLTLFVGYIPQVRLDARVVLEGAYDPAYDPGTPGSLPMRADLLAASALSPAQPYADAAFDETPLEYPLDRTLDADWLADHPDVVDWVIVDLRTGPDAETFAGRRVGLLRRDGRIVDFDGESALPFPGLSDSTYYVVVRHRNHVPVMSAAPVAFDAEGDGALDLTAPGAAYGADPAVEVRPGLFALAAGDLDLDGAVGEADEATWRVQNGQAGYLQADPGLDGAATAADLQEAVRANAGHESEVPEAPPGGSLRPAPAPAAGRRSSSAPAPR